MWQPTIRLKEKVAGELARTRRLLDQKMGQANRTQKCYHCQQDHRLDACDSFKGLPLGDKLSFIAQHRLCFACLRSHHSVRNCRVAKQCNIGGCKRRHHRLLHEDQPPPITDSINNACSTKLSPTQSKIALGAIKVNVEDASGRLVAANLLFDEGSDTTLLREAFARRLGVKGRREEEGLRLHGVSGVRSKIRTERIVLTIKTPEGERLSIEAFSIPQVCDPVPVIQWQQLKSRWSHLADLPLEETGGRIDILLGLDHAHLLMPLEQRIGGDKEPYAIGTRLGWAVRGIIRPAVNKREARFNFLCTQPEDGQMETPLDAAFRQFCNAENNATEYQQDLVNPEDHLAIDIFNQVTR